MTSRHCGQPLQRPFLDLGSAPPSNAYLSVEGLRRPETWYPLRLLVCESYWLVQTEDYAGGEALFTFTPHKSGELGDHCAIVSFLLLAQCD